MWKVRSMFLDMLEFITSPYFVIDSKDHTSWSGILQMDQGEFLWEEEALLFMEPSHASGYLMGVGLQGKYKDCVETWSSCLIKLTFFSRPCSSRTLHAFSVQAVFSSISVKGLNQNGFLIAKVTLMKWLQFLSIYLEHSIQSVFCALYNSVV